VDSLLIYDIYTIIRRLFNSLIYTILVCVASFKFSLLFSNTRKESVLLSSYCLEWGWTAQIAIARQTIARQTIARQTIAQHTIARHTIARHTIAWHTIARHTIARHTIARHTIAWHRIAQHTIVQTDFFLVSRSRVSIKTTSRQIETPRLRKSQLFTHRDCQ
jgi:hypothetical protein